MNDKEKAIYEKLPESKKVSIRFEERLERDLNHALSVNDDELAGYLSGRIDLLRMGGIDKLIEADAKYSQQAIRAKHRIEKAEV